MNTKTEVLTSIWLEARTRFSSQLENLTEEDLTKRLGDSPNSIGFLMQHIGDVEFLFAKNVFGDQSIKVIAKTVIEKKDNGEWTNFEELKNYVIESYEKLLSIISRQSDSDWDQSITTKEFGTKTKSEALGRIISHTTYHAGQIAIIKKYGTFKIKYNEN